MNDLSPLKPKLNKTVDFIQKIEKTIPQIPKPSGECKIIVEGKEHSFPILEGSDGGKFLDLRTLYTKAGYFVFDPGFMATGLCCSSITLTDGEKGQLQYRGYKIEDLARNCSFLEVCYLLLYGELPNKSELDRFESLVYFFCRFINFSFVWSFFRNQEMMVHELMISFFKGFQSDAHPMAIMVIENRFFFDDSNFYKRLVLLELCLLSCIPI